MLNSKKNILLFILCFATLFSVAQQIKSVSAPDSYRAIHWTNDDGLPQSTTHAMFKDARGFLWIGGEKSGLCRFDGAFFKKYLPGQKRGAINSDEVYTFKEDSLHNIWMGTGKGISRYDMKADTFTNFSPFIDSAHSQFSFSFSEVIAPFWATKDEMYCMEPGGAITSINIHTLKREKILQLSKTQDPGIVWNTNKSFFEKSSNSIWKLSWDAEGYGRLQQIFLDGRTQYYTWPCYNKTKHRHTFGSPPRHFAEDMRYDPKRNSVWINSGEGLLEFSLANKQFRKIEACNKLTKEKSYDRGVGVDIDRQGRIWFSTYAEGIFIYDPETDFIKPLFSDPSLQLSVGENNLHIYCDPDGIVWTSDWLGKGVYALLPFNPLVKRYAANPSAKNTLSSDLISTIVPGPQGKLWLGTADGLNIFDPVTETFEVLREKDLPGIKGTSILPLYIDTVQQKAWLNAGSRESEQRYFGMSMYEMDIKTRKCSHIVFMDGSKRIDTFSVMVGWEKPYKNGIIFCDEFHGVWQIKEGSLVANLLIPLVPGGAGFGNILLAEDRYLFLDHGSTPPNFAFENKNARLPDGQEKWTRIPNVLDNVGWYSALYNKKDQTYWVSGANLIHYNKEFREIKAYNGEDGYKGEIVNMQLDNYGNLWFANTSQQIGRLNTATGIISALSETDGYQKVSFFWLAPITKDGRGDLYFGIGSIGSKAAPGDLKWGLGRVYPERFSSVTSSVYLNTLSINQKPFSLNTLVNEHGELSLKYNKDTIRIEAGIIDFYSRKKGLIRYKLEQNGKMGDWQYPPDYIIRYEGLPPGSYRLVVQASNINNEFNSPEKILIINISPLFWDTWWFRILAAVAVTAVIYGFVQYRSRNLKKKNILLEKKVMQRTDELNKRTDELNKRTDELNNSLGELKATQDQLIQSEKMASLGELTSGIAHEIKNPLNFIKNFSEINMELITEMEEEQMPNLDENNQAEMESIIKTLKKNSEKINHHGSRIDGIVTGMLQHSRVGNTSKEPVNINSLCDDSLKLAYNGFKAKEKTFNASVDTEFDPDLPALMALPQDMGRVLLNLSNNAFYAVHEKKKKYQSGSLTDMLQTDLLYKPAVIVSTKKCDNKIFITISDNGMGIPSGIINKIFQPFFTTKPTGEGTGLGLSMSYDIITKGHGGELRVKSKEGEGTDFEIVLPVQKM